MSFWGICNHCAVRVDGLDIHASHRLRNMRVRLWLEGERALVSLALDEGVLQGLPRRPPGRWVQILRRMTQYYDCFTAEKGNTMESTCYLHKIIFVCEAARIIRLCYSDIFQP